MSKSTKRQGAVEVTDLSKIRKIPYPLPPGFSWNIVSTEEIDELCVFLENNYVTGGEFTCLYPADVIQWAITMSDSPEDWLLCVRAKGKIMAFISGISSMVSVSGSEPHHMMEVNFLSVHSKLRGKRLAPVLIKEIVRRASLSGRCPTVPTQGIYTLAEEITPPLTKAFFYYRYLNIRTLSKFGMLGQDVDTKDIRLRLLCAPPKSSLLSLREVEESDIDDALDILNEYTKDYKVRFHFSKDEIRRMLINKSEYIQAYAHCGDDGKIDSFGVYFTTFIGLKGKSDKIKVAQLMYRATKGPSIDKVVQSLLFTCAKDGHDMMMACNVMDAKHFFSKLGFRETDAELNYYLYNWHQPSVSPDEIAIILA